MKKISITILMCISFLTNSFAPLAAQQAPTFRQRISNIMPQPSLPSWAKGPGFEAAKKWYRDGYSTKNFSTEEKRAFRRFKKKFAIGAIISAVVIALGIAGSRYYAQEQEAKRIARASETEQLRKEFDRNLHFSTSSGYSDKPDAYYEWRPPIKRAPGVLEYTIPEPVASEVIVTGITLKKPIIVTVTETDNNDGTFTYTAQSTSDTGQIIPLQVAEETGYYGKRLLIKFEIPTANVTEYKSNARFIQFEKEA